MISARTGAFMAARGCEARRVARCSHIHRRAPLRQPVARVDARHARRVVARYQQEDLNNLSEEELAQR